MSVDLGNGIATGQGTDTLKNIENVIGSTLNDTIIGNTLSNTIDGGNGSDWVDYSYATHGLNVNLFSGSGSIVSTTDVDKLISIENVIGTNYDDTFSAGQKGAVNTFFGQAGNDTFYGYGDNDYFDGGTGNDAVDYGNISGPVSVTLGGSSADRLVSIENIYGTANNDTLVGDSNNNILNGRDGDDTFIGGNGDDTLIGGNGIDFADYAQSSSRIDVNLNLTTGIESDGGGTDTLLDIENVRGSCI